MRAEELDLPFAFTEIGDPDMDPTIVLPGGPCRGPEYLGDMAGLGATHRLVILHPRGTPRTGGLSRGWWTDADDVVTLADALGAPRVHVLAHSAGTRLALATAVRYPQRIRSLTLITPPAAWLTGTPFDGEAIQIDRADIAVAHAIASLELDAPETEESFLECFQRQAPATYAHWSESERTHASVGVVSLASTLAWFTDIPTDVVGRIQDATLPPTLVVAGDKDYLTGVQPVVDYAAMLGARYASIGDCGHYPWVEQPVEFVRIVEAWLAERRASLPHALSDN